MTVFMPQQALSAVLEKIINKALALNINDNVQLGELAQKTITIKLAELGFDLCFTVENKSILVTGISERSDCVLTASIASLIELQKNQQLTELIKQDKLDISGDLKVAQLFAGLFENITIDWQTELAEHIGDIPTYKLQQLALWLKNKMNFAASQVQADASEWLVHEKRLVVTSSQLDDFSKKVSDIAEEIKRLEQRIVALTDKVATSSTSSR